ncbi:amidase signature domain-containing protein [Desarmillaria tabescens]|uniref:Amidase signature domain-containing protein n=1 Tax=Armillaria tabescens TaxID=1929756 RepID=A0AA39TUF7_ARMTA|nr:amidase signature domain-containing protein [Desarmillaria tabescens]KAK0466783.1 amidase signature domain-containing protein [Desarmillaria tabescens]
MGSSFSSNKAVVYGKRLERARLLEEVASTSDKNSDREKYLQATACEIVSRIESGEWTATEVLEAYIARAVEAQAATNCLTEVMFKDARAQAKDLDAEFAATKKLLSQRVDRVKGYDTTIGFTQWANDPAEENAALVAQIIAAGGIPMVKTNVPQTMLSFECNNPLWGRTTNPYNPGYTCGGSSGGSDIAGSLRIPAAYCGIYSLMPSFPRVSTFGCRGPDPGFEGLIAINGPMARSVEDLKLFCRTLFGVPDAISLVPPMPYREHNLPEKLKFGYYTSDGFVKASPANKRAVLETVAALRKQGHECIEFEPPNVHEALVAFVALSSSDSYRNMLSNLGPDALDDTLKLVVYGSRIPYPLKALAAFIVSKILQDWRAADVLHAAGSKSYSQYSKWTEKRQAYNRMFYMNVWNKYDFDGIIAPVQALPQLIEGGATEFSPLVMGTVLYNVVQSSAGCIPVTRVDPEKDKLTEEWTKRSPDKVSILEDQLYREKKPFYDPVPMKGLPVGIQVVAKKWEEEKVLAMMSVIDAALGEDRGFGPGACRLPQKL